MKAHPFEPGAKVVLREGLRIIVDGKPCAFRPGVVYCVDEVMEPRRHGLITLVGHNQVRADGGIIRRWQWACWFRRIDGRKGANNRSRRKNQKGGL